MADGTDDERKHGNSDQSPPTKLRFPQGSEVWISGCPKFGTTEKSGLTNPEMRSEDGACQGFGHGARFSPLLGIDRGRCCRSGDWLGYRPFAVDLAFGSHRVLSARLRRRRGQPDAVSGRDVRTIAEPAEVTTSGISNAGPRPARPRAARMTIDPIHQFQIDKLFTIGHIGDQEIAFTNSSAYMLLAVVLISAVDDRRLRRRAARARAASSRSPRSPTSSSPPRCAATPARKA